MATYRIGIGSFNLKDGAVGLGTESSGLGNLKVEGTIKTTDLDVTGVSTFYRYAGFAADNINISIGRTTTLTGEHSTIGDIVVGVGETFTVSTGATIDVGTVESVSIGTHFSFPTGGLNDRPEVLVEGTVRFNVDIGTLEFYNGVEWKQFTPSGASGRAVWGGGYNPATPIWPSPSTTPGLSYAMDFVSIPTLGNAQHFGDLSAGGGSKGSMGGNGSRGLFIGGYWPAAPSKTQQIDYITIPSQGNGIDFGDLTNSNTWGAQGASSSTRGIRMAGFSAVNTIDYVEISTVGDAIDFGDLTSTRFSAGVCASPVRVLGGGGNNGATLYSTIDMITTSSKGNSVDDGDLRLGAYGVSSASSSTRGIWAGGYNTTQNTEIQYRTISSSGMAQYFGDLSVKKHYPAATSSQIRGLMGGGMTGPVLLNTIEYVTIATTGNSSDFGDLLESRRASAAVSDSHGGLGGY